MSYINLSSLSDKDKKLYWKLYDLYETGQIYESEICLYVLARKRFKLAKLCAETHNAWLTDRVFHNDKTKFLVELKNSINKTILNYDVKKLSQMKINLGDEIFYVFTWYLKHTNGEDFTIFLYDNDFLIKCDLYHYCNKDLVPYKFINHILSKYHIDKKNKELVTNLSNISLAQMIIDLGAEVNTKYIFKLFTKEHLEYSIGPDTGQINLLLRNGLDIMEIYNGKSIYDLRDFGWFNKQSLYKLHLEKQKEIIIDALTNLMIKDLSKIVCEYLYSD